MSVIQSYIAEIKACVKRFDDEAVTSAWHILQCSIREVRCLLILISNIEFTSRDVNREVNDVIRDVKQVYRALLQECKNIKYYSQQCEYMLQCLQSEIKLRNADLNLFLGQHRLQRYEPLFQIEGIAFVSELLEMKLPHSHSLQMHFKQNMHPADFNVFMRAIDNAALVRHYIDHCMTSDLASLGGHCKVSSEKVSSQLITSLQQTEDATKSIIRYLESQRSVNESMNTAFQVLGFLGLLTVVGGLCAFSLPGFIVAGAGALAAGGGAVGTVVTREEITRITRQIKDIKSMMFKWEDILKHGILSWDYLVTKFKELNNLLREGGIKLQEEHLHDITSHMQNAEKSLGNFQRQTDMFIEEVECVIKI